MRSRRTSGIRAVDILRLMLAFLSLALVTSIAAAGAPDSAWAATGYVARISSEDTWQDVFFNPLFASYVDDYILVGALSKRYARLRDGALQLEAEGQIAYVFSDQHYWQLNAVPLMARWQQFPWNDKVATSVAFGLGLSYATELPELEVELEGDSSQLLVYWVAELTAGPPEASWAVSLRLHHRSVAYGLFGEEGGMNAVGLGLRYTF
jgi:phytoene dehydrogenase-like protein